MNVLALILGIVAVVLFVIEGVRTKALAPWGLAALTAMVMVQWLVETGSPVRL